jgi:O-antigen/teichoic acid export membrane protein
LQAADEPGVTVAQPTAGARPRQESGGLTRLFRSTGPVAVGTAVGQALVLLATPFLARIYPPEAFGALALLMTVSNVAMAVACLRYDMALPSAAEDEIRGLLAAAITGALVLGVVAAVAAAWASGQPWGERYAGPLVARPVLIGACVALVGLYQAAGAWLLRRERYLGVAALRVAQGGSFALLAIPRVTGLLWAHALSFAAGSFVVWQAFRNRAGRPHVEVALLHRSFPVYGLPGALLDVVGYSLSIWVIAASYGRGAAGEYSQIQRLIGAPLMLLSISLGQVMLRQTAEVAHHRVELVRLLTHTLRTLVGLAVAGLVFLALAGAPLLAWILGPAWRVDRELVVLVGVAVFVRASVSPLSVVLLTLRRFRLALAWQAAYFASAALLMPFVAARVSFDGYVRFYAAHELAFYAAYLYLIFFAVRNE